MRIALLLGNDSLSHTARGLALRGRLLERGHEVLLIAGGRGARLLDSISAWVLPDLGDVDGAAAPGVEWFRPQNFERCLRSEADLLRELRPDRALGIFRLTGSSAAKLAGVPFDSLACGCVMPECPAVLGMDGRHPLERAQEKTFGIFRGYCAKLVGKVLEPMGLPAPRDIWELLRGRRTFLWDFPEFLPMPPEADVIHVGPIWCRQWPTDGFDVARVARMAAPRAVVAFGTSPGHQEVVRHFVRLLLGIGWSVVLAAGGQGKLLEDMPASDRLAAFEFVPLEEVLPLARVVLCHGGQGVIFDALRRGVPVLVVPFQPEQAHNGLCLERLGCGRRIFAWRPYWGQPYSYRAELKAMDGAALSAILEDLLGNPSLGDRLSKMSACIGRYDGAAALARLLEQDA
jgi:UDP:flavonoid glycosyltransferase YjiC (YdhE family)